MKNTQQKQEVPNILAHEYAKWFPPMSENEFSKLKTDIEKNGFDKRFPIIVYQGKILDGIHRHKACQETGVLYAVREFKGNDSDAVTFVLRANLQRRHLPKEHQAIIIEKAKDALRKHGGDNISKFRNNGNSKTNKLVSVLPDNSNIPDNSKAVESIEETAKQAGIGRGYFDKYRFIKNNGVPELLELAEAHTITLANGNYVARLSCAEQEEVVALPPSEIVAWVKNHKAKAREEKKKADQRAKDKERYELEKKIRESATNPQPTKEQTHFEKLMDGQIPQGPPSSTTHGNEPPYLNDIAASPDYISALKTLRNVQYEKDTDKVVEQLTSVVDSLNALLNFIEETREDN